MRKIKMRQKYSVPKTGRKRSIDVQPCVLKKDKVSFICNWKVLIVGKCFSIEMHDIEIFAKICHWHNFLPSKLIKWIMERTKGVSTSILQWWSGSAKRWGPTWTSLVNTSRKYRSTEHTTFVVTLLKNSLVSPSQLWWVVFCFVFKF